MTREKFAAAAAAAAASKVPAVAAANSAAPTGAELAAAHEETAAGGGHDGLDWWTPGRCVLTLVRLLLSVTGLILLVVGYSAFGGLIFMWLEGKNELRIKTLAREKAAALNYKYAADIYTQTQLMARGARANASKRIMGAIEERVKTYTTEIFTLRTEGSWDGTYADSGPVALDWTFIGSTLFCLTTIATIGYGYIAPRTTTGRIICIFYSIFGIPIMMLAIANVGLWFSKQVRLIHRKLSARCRKSASSPVQEVPVLFSLLTMVFYIFGGSVLFTLWEGWSFSDGAYFCFVTLSTIGFGDIVPGVYTGKDEWQAGYDRTGINQLKLVTCGFYLFFGLALLAMCLDLMKEEVQANFIWLGTKIGIIRKRRPTAP